MYRSAPEAALAVEPDGNGGVVPTGALTAVSPSGVGAAEKRSWSLAGER